MRNSVHKITRHRKRQVSMTRWSCPPPFTECLRSTSLVKPCNESMALWDMRSWIAVQLSARRTYKKALEMTIVFADKKTSHIQILWMFHSLWSLKHFIISYIHIYMQDILSTAFLYGIYGYCHSTANMWSPSGSVVLQHPSDYLGSVTFVTQCWRSDMTRILSTTLALSVVARNYINPSTRHLSSLFHHLSSPLIPNPTTSETSKNLLQLHQTLIPSSTNLSPSTHLLCKLSVQSCTACFDYPTHLSRNRFESSGLFGAHHG